MGLLDRAASKSGSAPSAGLLNRAAAVQPRESPVFDEMAVALIDRIVRLPPGDTTAYTALSLIKTYANFAAGLCIHLHQQNYQEYAAIGLGSSVGLLSLQAVSLTADSPSLIGTVQDLALPGLDATLRVWAYALDALAPTENAVLLVEKGEYPLPQSDLSAIFKACRMSFTPPSKAQLPISAGNPDLASFLREQYAQSGEKKHTLAILDQDPRQALPGSFPELTVLSLGSLGSAFPLATSRVLVFFYETPDPELFLRQLTKGLGAVVALSFEAPDVDTAMDAIGSLVGHD